MLRIGVSLIFLFSASAAEAQLRRGVDDNGRCVAPCSRAGGRPCRPCKPIANWSSTLGHNAWELYRLENEAYLQQVNALAAEDETYKSSPDYQLDLQDFSKGLEEQKAYLESIRRLRAGSRF
jgi:hypothetical protein